MPQTPKRTPHSRHNAELRERAFELHCQLHSTHAISVALGVPERTVRSWIKTIVAETTQGLKKRRVDYLREAVVGQRAIAASAWNAFNLTLDHERARLAAQEQLNSPSPRKGKGLGDEDTPNRRREATTFNRSARLLCVAFAAQREIAHLLRLYDDDVVPQSITRKPPWREPDPFDDPFDDLLDDPFDDLLGEVSDPTYHPDRTVRSDHAPIQRDAAGEPAIRAGHHLYSPPCAGEGPEQSSTRAKIENPATPATASRTAGATPAPPSVRMGGGREDKDLASSTPARSPGSPSPCG